VAQPVLGISPPVSPDGDPLTVTIDALPRGTVRNGAAVVHVGDHVTPDELSRLTFLPKSDFSGSAGSLRYTVENGYGGTVDSSIDVEVGPAPGAGDPSAETVLWESLRLSNDPKALEAFLRLFPTSRYADEARRRHMQLADSAPGAESSFTGKAEPEKPPAGVPAKPPDKPAAVGMPSNGPPIATPATPPIGATATLGSAGTGNTGAVPVKKQTAPNVMAKTDTNPGNPARSGRTQYEDRENNRTTVSGGPGASQANERDASPPGPAGEIERPPSYPWVSTSGVGLSCRSVTAQTAMIFGLDRPQGMVVTGVTVGSAAARAGIQQDDIILKINGTEVRDLSTLPRVAAETPAGRTVPVEIFRHRNLKFVQLQVDGLRR